AALNASEYESALPVPVNAGESYHIVVDGMSGWIGDFELGWDFSPGPPPAVTVDFAKRTALAGKEMTNQIPGGSAAVWFSWTAPADGQLSLETGDTNALVGVFVGDSAQRLNWMDQWGAACSLMVTVGMTYQLEVVHPPGVASTLAL